MTAVICLDILPIKFMQSFSDILRIQTNLIALIMARIFERNFLATLSLRTVQTFSMGSSLGLFSDHFRRVILLVENSLLISMNDGMAFIN